MADVDPRWLAERSRRRSDGRPQLSNCPTVEQVKSNSELPTTPERYKFAAWLPQIGGYYSRGSVSFDRETNCSGHDGTHPGCFDVEVFHDGDFPREEKTLDVHFCCAEQFIEFAVLVLAKMASHQQGGLLLAKDRDRLVEKMRALSVQEGT